MYEDTFRKFIEKKWENPEKPEELDFIEIRKIIRNLDQKIKITSAKVSCLLW